MATKRTWSASSRNLANGALVVMGGTLYAAAFPPHSWDAGAWVALVPLLVVAQRSSVRGAFAAGLLFGATFFAGVVPWVVEAVASYFATGRLIAVAASGAICVLFVAIYVGVFAVAAHRLLAGPRWRALVALPALWVSYELARSTLFTGLPWELLGHSQWRRTVLIQIGDWGGVYAVSYVVAAVNVGIYLGATSPRGTSRAAGLVRAATPVAVSLALVAATATYGMWRIRLESRRAAGRQATVALVQANQRTSWRWERPEAERSLLAHTSLSRDAIAGAEPALLVWPEYAVTLYPEREPMLLAGLATLARRVPGGLVFGAPRVEDREPPRYFNSAYHLASDGTLVAYDKRHLVPFAEYQPLGLGFGEALAAEPGSAFSAGRASTVFTTAVGRLGVLICYEVIFPELSRQLVRDGAEVLLNLSNDGWLDRAQLGAGAQHLSIAVFRAVENRRFLVRAASAGISGFVDPLGRPFNLLAENQRGVAVGTIEPRRDLTFYARHGDWFASACLCVGVMALLMTPRAMRRPWRG